MNTINFDTSNINLINKAEAWEIKDAFFGNILAKNTEFSDIKEALETLSKDFGGTTVIIKVGQLDKNGNITANSKSFSFVLPKEDEQQNEIVFLSQSKKNENLYNLNGIETPQKNNFIDIETKFLDLERRLKQEFEAKLLKAQTELEWTYRQKELDKRETEIKQKEKELKNKIDEYEEKLNKIIPPAKDILYGLVGNAINGLTNKESKNEEAKKEKENTKNETKINFSILEEDEDKDKKTKARKILQELNEEELNEVFEDFFEEEQEEQEEKTKNE